MCWQLNYCSETITTTKENAICFLKKQYLRGADNNLREPNKRPLVYSASSVHPLASCALSPSTAFYHTYIKTRQRRKSNLLAQ